MKLPRPKFTVRRLMIAVAVVGLMIGLGLELKRRRESSLDLFGKHSLQLSWWDLEKSRGEMELSICKACARQGWIDYVRSTRDAYDYHFGQAEKYRMAARSPWYPVEPDPPKPPEPIAPPLDR